MASRVPSLSCSAAGPGRRYLRVSPFSPNPAAASSTVASAAVPEPSSPSETLFPLRSASERIELSAIDQAEVLDRARRRLGDHDEAAHAATPAAAAGRAIGRARD